MDDYDSGSDVIDSKAVYKVNDLLLTLDTQIKPHLIDCNNIPLFDGYISVYKNSYRINKNYVDVFFAQVKGKTQKHSVFKEKITYPIEKDLLRVANRNLGLVFFVVCMEVPDLYPFQVYYTLLTFDKITKLLDEIKEHDKKSVSLEKFTSLKEFKMECLKYFDDKDIRLV